MLILTFITLLFTSEIYGSPFVLTEKYIEEFKTGLDALQDLAHTYQVPQYDYDGTKYNSTEAYHEADHFDFIIIGGGTSGVVLANRLSEVPEWKILLLESGQPETDFTRVPHLAPILRTTPYSWGYRTVPQEKCCKDEPEGECPIILGKALGGTSAINDLVYTRGNVKDFDTWADQGNEGWCHRDVLPYFIRIEDADLSDFDRKYHRHGGLLHLETTKHISATGKTLLGAENQDYNGKDQLGIGSAQIIRKTGQRNSVADAYLRPASTRKNLSIRPHSHVIKIGIGEHTKEANTVYYLHHDKLLIAKAEKEIILAAGPINSPQILLLSGVGPHDTLEHHQIPQIIDLPVGQNLKSQITYKDLLFISTHEEDETKHEDPVIDYLKNHDGPLSEAPTELIKFLEITEKKPELQLSISHPHGKNLSIAVTLLHPKSVGKVGLKDADPLHHPTIDPKLFSDVEEKDLETLIKGIQKTVEFAAEHGLQLINHPKDICAEHKIETEDYWHCILPHDQLIVENLIGTNRMGSKDDKHSVVDHVLKVHGLEKLRIADSSVVPITLSGNVMAPTVLIGEKCADLIKTTWK